MSHFRLAIPKSTKHLLVFLEAIKRVILSRDYTQFKETVGLDLHLVEPWFSWALNLVDSFREAYANLKQAFRDRTLASQQNAASSEQLSYTVRDFSSGLQRRVRRNGEDVVVLTYYRVPSEGLTPKATTPEEWREFGMNLVEGDALAVKHEHPAMVNPSAVDLQGCIANYDLHSSALKTADTVYQEAQQQMETLRGQTLMAWRGISQNLRLILADKEPASMRRFLRNFGFIFRGETEEEETTALQASDAAQMEVDEAPQTPASTVTPAPESVSSSFTL